MSQDHYNHICPTNLKKKTKWKSCPLLNTITNVDTHCERDQTGRHRLGWSVTILGYLNHNTVIVPYFGTQSCNWKVSLSEPRTRRHCGRPASTVLSNSETLLVFCRWHVNKWEMVFVVNTLVLWAAYKSQKVGSYGDCQVSESLHIPVCRKGDHPSPQPWPPFSLLSLPFP